jgi:hypothetical protein
VLFLSILPSPSGLAIQIFSEHQLDNHSENQEVNGSESIEEIIPATQNVRTSDDIEETIAKVPVEFVNEVH